MDSSPPRVSAEIKVINLPPWIEPRSSTVYVRVDRIVHKYKYLPPNTRRPILSSSSVRAYDPQPFTFPIDTSTNFSQIFQILHQQYNINSDLSQTLASEIIRLDVDPTGIRVIVLVEITSKTLLPNFDLVEGDNKDSFMVQITDELGLEKESCSICLDSLLKHSRKIPMRMVCSHLFHDRCIDRWLRRKNSCPICRRVFYEQ